MSESDTSNQQTWDDPGIIYVQVPRCTRCGSTRLRAYKTVTDIDGDKTRYSICLDCGKRLRLFLC